LKTTDKPRPWAAIKSRLVAHDVFEISPMGVALEDDDDFAKAILTDDGQIGDNNLTLSEMVELRMLMKERRLKRYIRTLLCQPPPGILELTRNAT